MSEVLSPLVYQLGIGGIGGFIVGYTIKKICKLIIILIGLFFILLLYLGSTGIITISFEKLSEALTGLLSFAGQAAGWLIGLISVLPFVGSFAAASALGFKLG
jgi:uncharacterized membrane protein (Fun14 family)